MIAWKHNDAGFWADGFAIDDVMIDVACGGVPLTIDIVTDIYGSETTWVLYDVTTGTTLASGGPYVDVNPYNAAAATYQVEVCVADGATLAFRINDAWGDGLFDGTNTGTFALSLPCQANFFSGSGAFPYGGGTPAPIESWDSTVFVVTSIPPVAGFSVSQTAATITTTNTTTGATSYSWDFGDGNTSTATSPNHTYTANGTYTVTLTATNACGSVTSTQSVTVTGVGIQEAAAQAMNIHPNPAFDQVQITLAGFNGQDAEIRVMNAVGQEVYTETIRQAGSDVKRNVDLSNVRKGVYFVTVKSADKLLTQKLIVK
jgi:PKD repeat protein